MIDDLSETKKLKNSLQIIYKIGSQYINSNK